MVWSKMGIFMEHNIVRLFTYKQFCEHPISKTSYQSHGKKALVNRALCADLVFKNICPGQLATEQDPCKKNMKHGPLKEKKTLVKTVKVNPKSEVQLQVEGKHLRKQKLQCEVNNGT